MTLGQMCPGTFLVRSFSRISSLGPFPSGEQVSDPGSHPSSPPLAVGVCVNGGWGDISHQVPEGGLGMRGLFCLSAVVSWPLEKAIGNSHWNVQREPVLARNLFSGREACPRNSREGTLQ